MPYSIRYARFLETVISVERRGRKGAGSTVVTYMFLPGILSLARYTSRAVSGTLLSHVFSPYDDGYNLQYETIQSPP